MTISLGLAGDVMIGRLVNESIPLQPAGYIWGDLLPRLAASNYNLINLEAALTRSEEAVPKVFNFKADPEKVAWLQAGHIHAVNLANNHILDYSEKGLFDTLDTLDLAGIRHVGAGRDHRTAAEPVVFSRGGVSIAILGYTDNEPGWQASPTSPGTSYVEVGNIRPIQEAIEKVRDQADIIILSIHWGPNMVERPPEKVRRFAHAIIDLGADIIHGHSAHIFQGVEVYKQKLILYDTGDFVDDYYVDPDLRNDRSFFFAVELTADGPIRLQLIPVRIADFQVKEARGKEKEAICRRMKTLSKELGTSLYESQTGLELSLT